MKKLLILYCMMQTLVIQAQVNYPKTLDKNGMKVSWYYENNEIHFTIEAPTTGWLAIGLHKEKSLKNATLYMGRIKNNRGELSEHFTFSLGNYKSHQELNFESQLKLISSNETKTNSKLHFTVPIKAYNEYHKDLHKGQQYYMTLAFSRDDDYQHHSMMRTSIKIKL